MDAFSALLGHYGVDAWEASREVSATTPASPAARVAAPSAAPADLSARRSTPPAAPGTSTIRRWHFAFDRWLAVVDTSSEDEFVMA